VGQTLGSYKLLERVGEGGCGVVYVAEQTEPVRRRVALKVIKLGMDTKQVVARFEAERQAVGMTSEHRQGARCGDDQVQSTPPSLFTADDARWPCRHDALDEICETTEPRIPNRTSSDQGGSQRLMVVESCSF
jgi:serine/threonine protein kinase